MSSPSPDDPSSTKRSTAIGPQVFVENLQEDIVINEIRWERLALQTLAAAGVNQGEMSISFVDVDTITELNEAHMGASGPTDVLAFPMDAADFVLLDTSDRTEEAPLMLGDVIIAPAVAKDNASQHGSGRASNHPGFPSHRGTLDDELALLVVHGTLHLLGHDHYEANETKRMHDAERVVLEAYVASAEPNGTVDGATDGLTNESTGESS